MAKNKSKKKGNTAWQPQGNDAINLATYRWYAIQIEAKAIELYGTDPSLWQQIETAMNTGLSALYAIKVKKPIGDDGDCPPGWVPCGEDCAPKCLTDPAEGD